MTLADLRGSLEALAKSVGNLQQTIALPPYECDLNKALTRLRCVLGDKHFQIILSIGSSPHEELSVYFNVYADGKRYEAATLEAALGACLLANLPPPARPLEKAQAVLDSVSTPIPF